MVKKRLLLMAFTVILVLTMFLGVAKAQQRVYHLNQEWVKIWINQDGTIDLFYNISMTLSSGPNITYVLIGQPRSDFIIR